MSPRSARILLVEDSYGDAVLTGRALEAGADHFELTVAGSLGEGIDQLERGFDAILLDLTLPDSTGTETVVRMRAAAGDLPIVVLSGADDADAADLCRAAGADGYEQKGRIDAGALRRVLGEAIERDR